MRSTRIHVCCLLLCLLVAPSIRAADPVRVTNFPDVQRVRVEQFPAEQAVRLNNHPPATSFKAWTGQSVAPVSPSTAVDDLERFHFLGKLDAAGFATLSLSLAGRLSGSRSSAHELELVLLPDQRLVRDAWKHDGVVLLEQRVVFELEVTEKGLFQSLAAPLPLRFDRYLAFLRNSSAQTLNLDLYVMLGE